MAKQQGSYATSYDAGDGVKLKVPYSFFGSKFDGQELNAIREVLQGETFTMGPQVQAFQKEFAAFCGTKYAFAVSNGTVACALAVDLLDLKPGDEVITTPITFIATSIELLRRGAVPVFADVQYETHNIDPASIRQKVTKKTRAIVVVHYGTQMCDMDEIMAIAREHKLLVVEDAAHTPGATYKGKKAGSIGDIGCFSFHPLKNMTTFEGGMLTFSRDDFADKIIPLRCIGLQSYKNQKDYWLPYHYDVVEVNGVLGNNYRMDEVRAAVGRIQLRKLDAFNAKRLELTNYVNGRLAGTDGIAVPTWAPDRTQVCYLFNPRYKLHARGFPKDDFLRILYYEEGVQAILHYLPNYLFSVYRERGYKPGLCPVAEKVFFEETMTLPMHPRFTHEQLDQMADGIRNAARKIQERGGKAAAAKGKKRVEQKIAKKKAK
ncbi:MAG: DegT/DnrJ/EryC1/StrS family aminotransferase [Lentisphaerae bacterium]|nr:DegT/DnrJ/EryC1/StrS family aminotransferase [Lentisphaerota bacterium]